MDIAESIESDDNKNWTVTLKDGYTFTNGEPVDADPPPCVELRRYLANAQNNSYFMNRIAGFDEMQKEGVKKDATFGV